MALLLETQSRARHCHRRKEADWPSRLETTVAQLSIAWLKTSPPIWNATNGTSPCLAILFIALFMYVHVCECLFLKSQAHILQEVQKSLMF